MKTVKISLLFLLITITTFAQNTAEIDTLASSVSTNSKFNYKQLILPAALIGYGVVGLESDQLKGINLDIRSEVMDDIDKKITIDDFIQYAPALSVYALNNLGVEGKNNLKDRSIVLGTSMVFVFTTVTALKK